MSGRKRRYDPRKRVRRLARALVGQPPPSHPIEPKTQRKKPKHKKAADEDLSG